MKFFRERGEIDASKYILAGYLIKSATNLKDASWNIAIGQSVGNPNIRNEWETEELFFNHSCIIVGSENELTKNSSGYVEIGFPIVNTDWKTDGISHLLCQLMGGHVDIDLIESCRLISLKFPPEVRGEFRGPKYGLSGMRKYVDSYGKPLLGGIIKPKIGMTPDNLLEMVKQLVDGGVDFIKEDEIMSNPSICPLNKRVDLISNYLAKQSKKIVFAHTINCDPHVLVDRVNMVYQSGGNAVHINVYSGLGAYNSVRKMDLPIFIHFQKSGDRVFTHRTNKYSISWPVICQLATMMGVDTIQTGMLGGYSSDDEQELVESIRVLREGNTTPVLSCGFHPGLVESISNKIGNEYMANVGGAIHGHPFGTTGGAKAMRQAIDANFGAEYEVAIEKWGKK